MNYARNIKPKFTKIKVKVISWGNLSFTCIFNTKPVILWVFCFGFIKILVKNAFFNRKYK